MASGNSPQQEMLDRLLDPMAPEWTGSVETPPNTTSEPGVISQVYDKVSRAGTTFDKLASLIESVDIDKVKTIIDSASKISARGDSFVQIIDEVLGYIKQPSEWLRYVVPIVLGVGCYLVYREKDTILVPAMRALCIAGVTYMAIPHAQKVLDWLDHLRDFRRQGGGIEKLFGSLDDVLVDEDSFLGPYINTIIKAAYDVDMSFNQVLHLLATVPRSLDGVHRIWGMITTLWSEIKLRVYAMFGWEAKSGDLTIDRLVETASDLVLQFKTDKLQFTHGLSLRIDELIKAHTSMVAKLCAENKGAMLTYVKSSLEALRKAQVEIQRRVGTGFTNRAEPVMICFYGKPGQGKTTLSQEVEKALVKAVSTQVEWQAYCENGRNAVFTVPPGLKHWEGVSNATKVIRIDELWAERELPGMEASQSLLLQQLINTAPFTPPMAFEMKGMISLEPSFVIATTNAKSLSVIKTLESPVAINRRLHFLVEVIKGDDEPFGELVDLTRIKMRFAVPNAQGVFEPQSRELSAPELVEEILRQHKEHLRKQHASYSNADTQADYLLGVVSDPAEYVKKLKSGKPAEKECSIPLDVQSDIVSEMKQEGYELPPDYDDESSWHAFNRIPARFIMGDWYKLRFFDKVSEFVKPTRAMLVGHFMVFCKVTGISWSMDKFMELIHTKNYWSVFEMPPAAFKIWLQTFGAQLYDLPSALGGIGESLYNTLKNIPSMIANWIDRLIPSFVRRTEVLVTIGGLLFTSWYFAGEIKKLFYSPDDFEAQSDLTPRGRGQKAINRDRKYISRIMGGSHDDDDPHDFGRTDAAYAGFERQMGERIPEIARNTSDAIKDNYYTMTCGQIENRLGFILFIKKDMFLMPAHFGKVLEDIVVDRPHEKVTIKNHTGEHSIPIVELLQKGRMNFLFEYYAGVWDVGRMHRDITVHFVNATEVNKTNQDFRNSMNVVVDLDGVTYAGLTARWKIGSDFERRKIYNVIHVDKLSFKKGDCGALYIAVDGPAAGKIVGMHIGGNSFNETIAIYLTKQIIADWFSNIVPGRIVKFNEPRTVLLGDIVPPERVSFTNAHCKFAGNEPVVPYQKTNVNITKAGVETRLANYDKVLPTNYDIEHIHDVTRTIGARVLSGIPHGVRRFTIHEAMFGIPGRFSSIDMSTSAGFPLQGTPFDKTHWRNEDGSMNVKVCETVRDWVQDACNDYARGIIPADIFKIFAKDEKLPEEDVSIKNKVRTINGGPIRHIIMQRMFFGEFTVLFEHNPLFMNHLIGVNLNAMDGDDLARRILTMDPTEQNCFGGDISKFEFNQKYDIQMSIFDNIVLPTMTSMTPEERVIARGIWDYSARSVHKWGDKLYMVDGCRASGEYLTSPGNSLYVLTAIMYSYYKAVNFRLPLLRTFYENVFVVAMGDDNVGSVSDLMKDKFDQYAIKNGLADLGLTYTSPNKDEITEPFIKFSDLVMLQCSPRYDAGLGRYVWQQNLPAILEIAQWTKKTQRKPDLNIWASNVFEALKKLCVHPKEDWDFYVPKVQRMIMGYNVEIPTWDYRAMQAIVFAEDDLRARFKFEYDSSVVQFEAQSGKRKDLKVDTHFGEHPPILVRVTPWGTYIVLDVAYAKEHINVAPVMIIDGAERILLSPVDSHAFWLDYFMANKGRWVGPKA